MPAILPTLRIDRSSLLARFFTPYQLHWITVEDAFHARGEQAIILAEKSVRIGWTFADAFKNVRKRLHLKNRDYLFATKDYPSALEYMRLCRKFADVFNLTRCVISHGEEYLKVKGLDEGGKPTGFTEEIKMGVIKFDSGSRIIAFSAHPQAMAVYGGDVGLDEFAKHNHARLLWETAQGRVAWGGDLAVWSAHDGEDTLFNEFVHEARLSPTLCRSLCRPLNRSESGAASLPGSAGVPAGESASSSSSFSSSSSISGSSPSLAAPRSHERGSSISGSQFPSPGGKGQDEGECSFQPHRFTRGEGGRLPTTDHSLPTTDQQQIKNQKSKIKNSNCPWNLYYRVTLTDAIDLGLLEVINRTQNKNFTHDQFIADCRARARQEEIFQQSYMCNPLGASTNHIVEWSAIERCRYDYDFVRVHLEHSQIVEKFGDFSPTTEDSRSYDIESFIRTTFRPLFDDRPSSSSSFSSSSSTSPRRSFRLGFDVAASGQGDLAVIYIDQVKQDDLWLAGLFSCRTEDWHFLQTVLFKFMKDLRSVRGAGDASGLGRQICWDTAKRFSWGFTAVNFASKKHDLGFALMNQLATAKKRFPRSEQDIAADFFALRKSFEGTRWVFSEGRNSLNAASHCDIAWAAALASAAHLQNRHTVWAVVG
jgi:phage FluMu gp28-like protein